MSKKVRVQSWRFCLNLTYMHTQWVTLELATQVWPNSLKQIFIIKALSCFLLLTRFFGESVNQNANDGWQETFLFNGSAKTWIDDKFSHSLHERAISYVSMVGALLLAHVLFKTFKNFALYIFRLDFSSLWHPWVTKYCLCHNETISAFNRFWGSHSLLILIKETICSVV